MVDNAGGGIMGKKIRQWMLAIVLIGVVIGAVFFSWNYLQPQSLPEGIASGNGRIEATEVDITTKLAGRVVEVLAAEGDSVVLNQELARIDTNELKAQYRLAEAMVEQARQDKSYAIAVVEQRQSELALASSNLARSQALYKSRNVSLERLQQDETAVQTARAALTAASAGVVNKEAAIQAAIAKTETIKVNLDDSILRAPISGRVLYRLVEPGEVLGAGGKVLTVLNLTDVYMQIYLPTAQANRVRIGSEAHILLDALPGVVIPATVTFVAPEAQFTPREVETRTEREKLMFRVKVRIDPELLKAHVDMVKTGIPGVAYVRTDQSVEWPPELQVDVEKLRLKDR
ncbi:MAG: HlyD family efflux transporter periplasmic adaptor subunit [Spongiibacteraceae bacterium]